ncbi:hypothetical protein EX30DRAFT_318588, partial [Ascodesmis nigricans]
MEVEVGEEHSGVPRISGLQRTLACDTCRVKKIRCDKGSPCSNCRTSNASCRTSAGRRKEPKQRVLISSSYEKKIDRIEERLAGIENILRASLNHTHHTAISYASSTPSQFSRRHSPSATSQSLSKSECEQQNADTPDTFEGDTSLTAHSKYASELLERAVETTQIAGQSPEMTAALDSLRNIVNRQNYQSTMHDFRFPSHQHQRGHPAKRYFDLPLPPAQAVRTILRQLKLDGAFSFTVFFPFLRFETFSRYCQDVMLGTEDYPLSIATIVHGSLYYLFWEASQIVEDRSLVEEYQQCSSLCKDNFELCLSSFDLLMPATFENIVALIIGATYAVEKSRPSLCGMLINMAVTLCQSLGYHRSSTTPTTHPSYPEKQYLFWLLYAMDKGLSVRLGRASAIQDYDITLPMPTTYICNDERYKPWTSLHQLWIFGAQIQGNIYEHLYSPAAMRKSASERERSASSIVEDLERMRRDELALESTITPDHHHFHLLEGLFRSDSVFYWSSLTLVYRALPPTLGNAKSAAAVHPSCVSAARKTLEVHLECHRIMRQSEKKGDLQVWGMYLHWFIIHLPFTPFIVTFCNIISTPDRKAMVDDLRRLEAFLNTLAPEPGNLHTSEAAEKLYHLCLVFHRVAVLYVDAQSRGNVIGADGMQKEQSEREVVEQNDSVMVPTWGGGGGGMNFGELGPYLNALGFVDGG